ncbi:hypothetical protein NDU88_006093 [Pleurodeles waltl]|uniref:Reverse transcriptase domain-containing protein n=1 Tax=Pleurodeles waltl TaxID=8319 RepID=A0AAV7VKX5_PLEWA|nr:hypothetical protein NDU88_006093 [Pleurodeles waltl]
MPPEDVQKPAKTQESCGSGVSDSGMWALVAANHLLGPEEKRKEQQLEAEPPRVVGTRPLHVLMYADDWVLLERTGRELRKFLDRFVAFMSDLSLSTNKAKSVAMVCGDL